MPDYTYLFDMAVAGSVVDGESAAFCNAASNSSSGGGLGSTNNSSTSEFCERHARAAASDFAKSCVHYVNKNLPENVRTTISHRDFMLKFIQCFSENFESEFSRRSHHKVCEFYVSLCLET